MKTDFKTKMIMALFVVAFFGILALPSYFIQTNIEYTTIDVVNKERLLSVSSDSEGKSRSEYKNFVYTADESYIVKDSLWNWHFRAGTVFAQIPDGKSTCEVTLSGYRWGFVSMYQNIIEADCK